MSTVTFPVPFEWLILKQEPAPAGFDSDPFKDKEFGGAVPAFAADPFAGEDPFKGGKVMTNVFTNSNSVIFQRIHSQGVLRQDFPLIHLPEIRSEPHPKQVLRLSNLHPMHSTLSEPCPYHP